MCTFILEANLSRTSKIVVNFVTPGVFILTQTVRGKNELETCGTRERPVLVTRINVISSQITFLNI